MIISVLVLLPAVLYVEVDWVVELVVDRGSEVLYHMMSLSRMVFSGFFS